MINRTLSIGILKNDLIYILLETDARKQDELFQQIYEGIDKNATCDQISPNHPLYGRIMSYYNSIAASVQAHSKAPSFFAKSAGKAQNIELEWDGEKYTATLTDHNNVLSNYSFSASVSGIRFSASENKLTITADEALDDCALDAFVTNLDKYNEGELIGERVKFPITNEEMQKVFKRIGIGGRYAEWFITGYDCPDPGIYDLLG